MRGWVGYTLLLLFLLSFGLMMFMCVCVIHNCLGMWKLATEAHRLYLYCCRYLMHKKKNKNKNIPRSMFCQSFAVKCRNNSAQSCRVLKGGTPKHQQIKGCSKFLNTTIQDVCINKKKKKKMWICPITFEMCLHFSLYCSVHLWHFVQVQPMSQLANGLVEVHFLGFFWIFSICSSVLTVWLTGVMTGERLFPAVSLNLFRCLFQRYNQTL